MIRWPRRAGLFVVIVLVILFTALIGIANQVLLMTSPGWAEPLAPITGIVVNLTASVFAVVGSIVVWRRPGHLVGRLVLIAGPLYAVLTLSWQTLDTARPLLDPRTYAVVNWVAVQASWAGIALITGWIPLLFPSGSLPGRGWRLPVGIVAVIGTGALIAGALRPGEVTPGIPVPNPFGLGGWPPILNPLVDALPLALIALLGLAAASLAARYRRGEPIERLQVRWLLAAVSVVVMGFAAILFEDAIRTDDGDFVSAVAFSIGVLLMPVAIGIAILRYRLYEIDRIISRTVRWGTVSVVLVALFVALVLGLQAALASYTEGDTIAVAVTTLVVAALFQPLRAFVQRAVDRRFDRARYDREQVVRTFGGHLRDVVDLEVIVTDVGDVARLTVRPVASGVWLRPMVGSRGRGRGGGPPPSTSSAALGR